MKSRAAPRETMDHQMVQGIREHLRMSRDDFALHIGLCGLQQSNVKMIECFETDAREPSLPMAKLIWMLGKYGEQDWPEQLLATPLKDAQ